MAEKTPVIHYINQFFAGLGGEEAAGTEPQWFDGPKGPGNLLAREGFEIVGTVAAGDNFMAENLSRGVGRVVALIETHIAALDTRPALLLAGPAFNAGRYGMACAAVCQGVEEKLGQRRE